MNEYYAVVRSTDHLAHYGIQGMKWGVRKAHITGNERALDRHFRKAAKKLRRLQDKALNSKKYAAKAAAYGVAAAGTGTIAVKNNAVTGLSSALAKRFAPHAKAWQMGKDYLDLSKKNASTALDSLIKSKRTAKNAVGKAAHETGKFINKNSKYVRIGAGVASAGFAGLAARNAYVAANSSKYLEKASNFKKGMDEAFTGTKYAKKYIVERKPKKKKRR